MSRSANRDSDDHSFVAFLSPIGASLFILKLKFALLAVPGLATGYFVALSLRGLKSWQRLRVFLLGITFLALTLFIGFGLPFR